MSKVFWTAEEKAAVARQSFEFRRNDVTASNFECVEAAQCLIFAPERRRPLKGTISQLGFIQVAWTKLMDDVRAGRDLPPLPAEWQAGKPKNVVDEVVDGGLAEARITPIVPPHVEREYQERSKAAPEAEPTQTDNLVKSLSQTSTTDLIVELMSRMTVMLDPEAMRKTMRDIANEVVEARVPKLMLLGRTGDEPQPTDAVEDVIPKHNPHQRTEATRIEYRKVLVLGLSNGQENMMRREFPGVDFHFLSGSEGAKRLENTHKMVELTIKTNWVKGTLPSTSGWKNFVYVSGIDGIRKQMKDKFGMVPLR